MAIPCNRCGFPLPARESANTDDAVCRYCQSYSTVRVFPALFFRKDTPVLTHAAAEGEAVCYEHPGKRAVAACGQCGRFVCQLCSVEMQAGTWCPDCFSGGGPGRMRPELEQSRVLYDSIALTLAVGAPLVLLPLLPLTFFTALAACYLAIRYWKSPGSRTSRWKWRAPAAFVLGLGQVGLWLLGGAYLWTELWPLLRQ